MSETTFSHKDAKRFIIAKGQVIPMQNYDGDKETMQGYIKNLSIERIHVPLEHGKQLNTILNQDKPRPQLNHPHRYTIELAYGSRWEPRVSSVKKRMGDAE